MEEFTRATADDDVYLCRLKYDEFWQRFSRRAAHQRYLCRDTPCRLLQLAPEEMIPQLSPRPSSAA